MSQKISAQQLGAIIEQARKETNEDFANLLKEVYGPDRDMNLDDFISDILPKLLSATYAKSMHYAENVIRDVLEELELLTDDSEN